MFIAVVRLEKANKGSLKDAEAALSKEQDNASFKRAK
jgi:hypothetical protein